jgi:hypothetical protein
MHLAGVNEDADNQLCSFGKRGVIIGGLLFLNQMLVWGKEVVGVQIAVVQDYICYVLNYSKVTHHLYGHVFPPKLSLSIMRRMLISTSFVQVCTAVAALRWCC